jgi:sugar phosphate permease
LSNRPGSHNIFFGWWTVLACSIVGFLGVGIVGPGLSVLFKPIAAELDLSRAVASLAASVQSVGQGISGPTAGWAADRYGPRRIMLLGIVLLVLGLVAMYFVRSLWAFLLVWGLLVGVGFSFGCTLVTDIAIVRWFVKKSGMAVNIKFAVQSLSGLLLLPAIAWFSTLYDWRMTCVSAAVLIGVVCIPLIWFFVKQHRPEHYGLLPDGAARAEATATGTQVDTGATIDRDPAPDYTLRQTIKTRAYWLMIVVAGLSGAAAPMMGVHCIPFLTDMGIEPVAAAAMMAIVLTSGIPARLITGFVLDRVKTGGLRNIIGAGLLLQAAGVTAFLMTRSVAMIYVWFFLFGIGAGVTQSVQIPLWARYFGRKAYGAILGSTMAMNVPVALIAPVYIGRIYDQHGSYMGVIVALAILTALSGVVAFFISPPGRTTAAGAPTSQETV